METWRIFVMSSNFFCGRLILRNFLLRSPGQLKILSLFRSKLPPWHQKSNFQFISYLQQTQTIFGVALIFYFLLIIELNSLQALEFTNENMQKHNVNVVVFDQDQSFITEQSRIQNSTNRRQTTYDGFSANQSQVVLNNEISLLTQKINGLQDKAIKIQQAIKSVNNTSLTDISSSVNNITPTNSSQIQELLRVVETKIQIIVQETKRIIEKMTSELDKKLSKVNIQKNHEASSIAKIQAHCRDTIAKVEQNYQEQINLIRSEHLHLEKRLIQRVQQIQTDYKKKLKDFQSKQQQYIATIQHLESKIKQMTKSKKMIEVTQDRPTSSIRTDAYENMSNYSSSQQFGSSNTLHDTSKRRTRIFDSNRSVSPNNKVLSPLKSQENIKRDNSQVKVQIPEGSKKSAQNKPMSNNYISQAKTVYTQLKPPMKNEQPPVNIYYSNPNNINIPKTYQNPNPAPNSNMNSSNNSNNLHRNDQQQQQHMMRQASQKQFLKDAPKVHWQRFQDFNENQGSGSDEDVFFYTEQQRNENQKSKSEMIHNDSDMHSPFDLN